MALKSKTKATRISIPHEDGQWLELRQPSAGDLREIKDLSDFDYNLALMGAMVSAWSYPDELCQANLADLDAETYSWLTGILPVHMGLRSSEAKNESSSPSQAGPEPVTAASLVSSAT